jgi:tetratricopeptide (TPR) repeat protein
MTRSIALAALLGALVAGVAVYAFRWAVAPPLGVHGAAQASAEPWPICTTMDSIADVADWAPLDPDFTAGKKALGAGDWNEAIAALKLAALRDPQNADIQNYIGYAHRRLRQLELAFAHYQQALALNPRHRSAHEHLGEVYLVKGNLMKAQEHLVALQDICLIPCIEYDDLQTAITAYKRFTTVDPPGIDQSPLSRKVWRLQMNTVSSE